MPQYLGFDVELPVAFNDAVGRVKDALKQEGFGILTEIDLQPAFREKLGREFRQYVILGACNPPLAFSAINADPAVGLLLPCNVIVYETEAGRSAVAAMAPIAALGIVGENAELQGVAREADQRLRRALTSLEKALE